MLLLSLKTRVRTLFGDQPPEQTEAPLHLCLNVLLAALCITCGSILVQTGEAGWWGAGTNIQAYGPSVRAAGVVAILIGIVGSYDAVTYLCRAIFRAIFKDD